MPVATRSRPPVVERSGSGLGAEPAVALGRDPLVERVRLVVVLVREHLLDATQVVAVADGDLDRLVRPVPRIGEVQLPSVVRTVVATPRMPRAFG
jgi:hypothetical protein